MKLILDMNIPFKYAHLLADKGFEVMRWSDIGSPTASDTEIMEYARENDFIVLTCDLDFSAILSSTHDVKPSVAQIRASVMYAERAIDLVAIALHKYAEDLKEGAILSIELKKARLRLLPL